MAIIYSTIIAYETRCYSPLPVGSVIFSFGAKRSSELRVDAGVAECQWQQQGDRGAVSRRAWPPRDTCDDRPWNLRKLSLASPKVERINYYDDYNFFDGPSFKEYTNVNLMRKKNAQNATGHPTGSVTLTTGGERLYGVTYYTAKGLPCDTRQSCLGGKVLLSRTEYSFTDKPLRTVWEVRHDGRTDSVVYANSYSPVNDALAIQLVACNGGAPRFVSRLEYDDLGRLVRKTLPGNSGSVEYAHNVRGWLTTLSGPGYTETLSYDGLYNGNIASVSHSYQNGGVRDTFRYTFAYDNLNRMVSAGNDHYGESVDYDRNGNVVALHRYGKRNNGSYGLTDDLQLHYVGNHIRGITDRQGGLVYEGGFDFKPKTVDRHRPYEYNTVGALAHDPDRNVTVSYSVLGTPAMIAYGNGNTTEYIYDADGTKLKTTWKTRAANALCSMVAAEETGAEAETDDGILSIQASVPSACVENSREQVGPFIFTDGKLERVLFDGGFCLLSGQYTAYCYYVCDHLGSVREVVSDAWNVQRNGYYAYGGPYGDWNTNADVQPLKFLGKEWDHQHGLDLYDFGARLYDPAVGRWTTMDPLCEKYYSVSPYAYCAGNSINRVDLHGDSIRFLDMESMDAVYNALLPGMCLTMELNNGVLVPHSIQQIALNSQDDFWKDLYGVSVNSLMVEIATTYTNDYYMNGKCYNDSWEPPFDIDYAKEYNKGHGTELYPKGKTISGNLGQTLYPKTSGELKRSLNNNLRININAKGSLNHRTCGVAHELGHVVLFLKGLPHSHTENGKFIYARQWNVMKRLGYDYVDY